MGRPQQPEIARSGRTELDPDSIGTELESRKAPQNKGRTGPVPPENQPGHHPEQEADQPDLDAFVSRLTGEEEDGAQAEAAPSPREERPSHLEAQTARPEASFTPNHATRRRAVAAGMALSGLWLTVRMLSRRKERLSNR
jgi:hypothetical protein